MTLREIKSLIERGENDQVEFKTKVVNPQKIVKEIVAFANTRGGHLLVGVDDKGDLPGLNNLKEEAHFLDEAISRYCKPPIKFRSQYLFLSKQKGILHYTIYESKKKPHYVIESPDIKVGNAYVRVKDMSVKASREAREILKGKMRNRNIGFQFGGKEKILLQYLEQHRSITLDRFCEIAELKKREASNTLIILALANIITITPGEFEDVFQLKKIKI